MKKRMAVVLVASLLAIVFLPQTAMAGKPSAKPGDDGGAAGVVITTERTATSVFITDEFVNVKRGTHVEETKVYSPDGGLYQTFSSTFSPVKGAYAVTHEVLVAGTWAETLPGTWTARVYLDGTQLGTATFELP